MIDANLLADIEAGSYGRNVCVDISWSTPLRLTDCDHDLVVDGDTYVPWPVTVDLTEQLGGGPVQITIQDDDDRSIEALEDAEDAAGTPCRVWRVYRPTAGPQLEELVWSGRLEDADSDTRRGTVTVRGIPGGQLGGDRVMLPIMSDGCINTVSVAPCQATPGSTCDQSLARCIALGQTEWRVASWGAPKPGTTMTIGGTGYRVPEYYWLEIPGAKPDRPELPDLSKRL
jgi:hypothetical protein